MSHFFIRILIFQKLFDPMLDLRLILESGQQLGLLLGVSGFPNPFCAPDHPRTFPSTRLAHTRHDNFFLSCFTKKGLMGFKPSIFKWRAILGNFYSTAPFLSPTEVKSLSYSQFELCRSPHKIIVRIFPYDHKMRHMVIGQASDQTACSMITERVL